MSQMIEICVIVESNADFRTATQLAERVLKERIDWLDFEFPSFRWSGLEANSKRSLWQDINQISEQFKQRGLHIPKYQGQKASPLKADGAIALKVLNMVNVLIRKEKRDIRAILFIRDADSQPERKEGLSQAKKAHSGNPPETRIVLGVADRMREAWVLNGFEPLASDEKQVLSECAKQLGFDPCEEAHRLRSGSKKESERMRNPKYVLEKLTGGDFDRERKCWEETPLELLRKRGQNTGLNAFLIEIEQELVPLIDPSQVPRAG